MKPVLAVLIVTILIHSLIMVLAPAPAEPGLHIIVDKMSNELFLFEDGELKGKFPVATGREPDFTPVGRFPIISKSMVTDPASQKLFGTRWMGLGVPGKENKYGIHGTGEPGSIGEHASAGCIRMFSQDAEWLFDIVEEGTVVYVGSNRYHLLLESIRRSS